MNWPGGQFFAPESLVDRNGRRIIWAWVTDPRTILTQRATGSGVQSLPRVLALDPDGTLTITPAEELKTLRRNPRKLDEPDRRRPTPRRRSKASAATRSSWRSRSIRARPRRSAWPSAATPDGKERDDRLVPARVEARSPSTSRTRPAARTSSTPRTRSTPAGSCAGADYANPRTTVDAPFDLKPGEPLKLRVFLDKPMLEVFANDRQCITEQVFPASKEALGVKIIARGGPAVVRSIEAWDMAPARFVDQKGDH